MLAILVLILVLIWAAVVWSIYSNFLVFYSNFSETENYHKWYYASISALERAELVTKQRQPWYVWSGGFVRWVWTGSQPDNTDWWSDKSLSWFSYYWNDNGDTTVFRTINSRAKRIPAEWDWDVEWLLSADDSINYNMMDYENSEVFLLYYDESKWNPYVESSSLIKSNISTLEWKIRLPKFLSGFGNLDDVNTSLMWSASLPKNDPIVDWQIRWNYKDSWEIEIYPFTIYSTEVVDVGWSSPLVREQRDTVFREKDINGCLKDYGFKYGNGRNPFKYCYWRWDHANPTIISKKVDGILDTSWLIFNNSSVENLQIRFSLLNLLQWNNWSEKHIYPFLEYYVDFWWATVSDRYYTITAEWEYRDYNVDMIIRKPVVKQSVFWSFTSIF